MSVEVKMNLGAGFTDGRVAMTIKRIEPSPCVPAYLYPMKPEEALGLFRPRSHRKVAPTSPSLSYTKLNPAPKSPSPNPCTFLM